MISLLDNVLEFKKRKDFLNNIINILDNSIVGKNIDIFLYPEIYCLTDNNNNIYDIFLNENLKIFIMKNLIKQ